MVTLATRSGPPASPNTISPPRRHDLDALRGFAMLLGVALHASLSFFPNGWPAQDGTSGDEGLFDEFFHAVHGFRMPLFFLLSGYFSALLWKRRGLEAVVRHRLKRIVLPLAIALTILGVFATSKQGQDLASLADVAGSSDAGMLVHLGDGHGLPAWLDNIGHLWFLALLVWLMVGFSVVASVIDGLGRRAPGWGRSPAVILWLLPATTVAGQWLMGERGAKPVFGPDTSLGLVPAWHVLAYYALFFTFGGLLYERRGRRGELLVDRIGRRWAPTLPIAVLVVFPLGMEMAFSAGAPWALVALVQATYTWMMCFGLIGLFRTVLSRPLPGVRYLSDASYWMYLMHLPLVVAMQLLAADWDASASVKFWLILVLACGLLLVAYQLFVRYTLVGTLLNGKRVRPPRAAVDRGPGPAFTT